MKRSQLQENKEALFKNVLAYENRLSQLIADGSVLSLINHEELNEKKRIVLDVISKLDWKEDYWNVFKDSPTMHLINERETRWTKSHLDKVDTLIKDIRSVKRMVRACLELQKEPGELYSYLMDFNVSEEVKKLHAEMREPKSDGITVTHKRISAIYVWGGNAEEVYTVGTEVYVDTDKGTTPVFVSDIQMENDTCVVYGELYKQSVVLATFVHCPIRVKYCYDIVEEDDSL